jgi:hypothetical protein
VIPDLIFSVTVEAFVHTSLDLYSFIATTGSSSTLRDLIEMVRIDNNRRQQAMDETGKILSRKLKVNVSSIYLINIILISYNACAVQFLMFYQPGV